MLRQRIITALVLVFGFAAAALLLPPSWFAMLVSAGIVPAGWEWSRLAGLRSRAARIAYVLLLGVAAALLLAALGMTLRSAVPNHAATMAVCVVALSFWLVALGLLLGFPGNRRYWDKPPCIGAMGLFVLLPGLAGIVWLKYAGPEGQFALSLIVIVAAVDIGAYFTGRGFGSRQLAPRLSPKKSWEGVWGGVALCVASAVACIWAAHHWLRPLQGGDWLLFVALALAMAALCVIGDLLGSMLKRNRDIKDSGNLLPGHGGLLDRIDGLLAATPAFVLGIMLLLEVLQRGPSP